MFVLQSNYNKVVNRCNELRSSLDIASYKYALLRQEWNDLIDVINKKGGLRFLKEASIRDNTTSKDFTKEEIKLLISLCHPDKHCGSKKAGEITKKLLAMRQK